MPILACRCKDCGSEFEYLSMGTTDSPSCPECRSGSVERLFSPFAVGSGSSARMEGCECPGGPAACPHPCPRALAGA